MESFKSFVIKNRNGIIGCIIGIAAAILIMTVGFFQTLLVCVLGAAGAVIGGSKKIRSQIARLFTFGRKNDDDFF